MIAIDIEATCGDIPPSEMETIELGAVRVPTFETFHRFVRPVIHPKLTEFCVNLTGIHQEDIDAARDFGQAICEFEDWCRGDIALCSWGSFDKKQISQDVALFAVRDFAPTWVDLARVFKRNTGRVCGRERAMRHLGLKFEGRRHSGRYDAVSTALIAVEMMKRGWVNHGAA